MTDSDKSSPGKAAPAWLVRLTFCSLGAAFLALCAMLWAKWGAVMAMTNDILRYCFG